MARWRLDKLYPLLLKKQAELGRDITYADIAEATGLTVSLVGRYMKANVANPPMEVVSKFANYFGVSVTHFIEEDGTQGNRKATAVLEVAVSPM